MNIYLSSTSSLQMKGWVTKPGKEKAEKKKERVQGFFYILVILFHSLTLNVYISTYKYCAHCLCLDGVIYYHSDDKNQNQSPQY